VASAVPSSRITATSYRTISTREAWAGLGEMITRTTFRPLTGGAMGPRDLAGSESAPSNAADSTFSNLSKVKSKEEGSETALGRADWQAGGRERPK